MQKEITAIFFPFYKENAIFVAKKRKNGTQKNFSGYHFFPSGGDAL